ncbi:MAG TPA: CHAT domain-containing protein, partial [Urbifossiella sp.]|nr:CHAT domain-containing protein [Urbifossiella sp.]
PPAAAFRRAEAALAADRFGEAEPLFLALTRGEDRYYKRQSYERLLGLYVRSGRPDRAVKLADPYRAWLAEVGDGEALPELDLLLGECYLGLGYPDRADVRLAAALDARPALPSDRRLEALRLRGEVSAFRKRADEADRWAALRDAAAELSARADRLNDTPLRVTATRYRAEALFRGGDADAALAALAALPDLHDRLRDPLGRRDTQRLRAKLLAGRGRFPDAAPLFAEALELQQKHQPGRRVAVGDILAEWATAAAAVGKHEEAAARRDSAAIQYKAAIDDPGTGPESGGPLAAFVKLQLLTRSGRQFRQALEVTRTAAERWDGDPLVDGRLNSDRGGLELMTASYQPARRFLAHALADLDAADLPNLRALPQVLVNLATAELACDAPDRAEPLLTRCLALYATHGLADDPVRAECEYLRGVTAARRGDYAAAMRAFRAGLAVCDRVGPPADPVRFNLALNTALIHKEQGDADRAGDALKDAAAVLARFATPDDLSFALIDAVRADLAVAAGRVAEAVAIAPRLEAACARQGLTAGYLWTTARHVRALDRLVSRDPAGAEAIWAELAEAQRKDGNLLLARSLNFLGVCAELRGRDADARRRFEEARAFQAARPNAPPVTRAVTLWRLAVLTEKAGEKDEAKRLLAEVFDIADRARLNTFGEAAQRAQFFAQFTPAFELLARWHARDGDGEGLLRVVARSRSRTLLDQTLAAGVDPRDRLPAENKAGLLARETAARAAVSKLRSQALALPADKPDDPAAIRVLAELTAAQQEYADAWREIANADPLTRSLTDPAFAEAALARARREVAAGGGALVAYMLGRDESFAVLCTAGPPEVFRLTVPRWAADGVGDAPVAVATARVGLRGIAVKAAPQPDRPAPRGGPSAPLTDAVAGRLVDHYLRQIADPGFNPTRGIAVVSKSPAAGVTAVPGDVLGEAVLPAALRDRLRAAGAKRVVVIPDAALHKIPFEALLVSSGGPPRYALDELPPVCYAPSPAVLAVVTARPRPAAGPASLLTVGDPAYPEEGAGPSGTRVATRSAVAGALPRLPYTAVESETVRRFFPADRVTALLREAATESAVTAAIPGKRFIHLAAHGFADDAFGNLFAAVALTPPPPGTATPENDGFLSLNEIYRLNLSGCELTVLSACVTNVGPQRPLEAGVTLSGAFLSAGSRGVMASCWSVDDRATAELMGAFFAGVNPTGPSPGAPADALRAARLAVRGRPGWEAPFYWAPFVYVGPPR